MAGAAGGVLGVDPALRCWPGRTQGPCPPLSPQVSASSSAKPCTFHTMDSEPFIKSKLVPRRLTSRPFGCKFGHVTHETLVVYRVEELGSGVGYAFGTQEASSGVEACPILSHSGVVPEMSQHVTRGRDRLLKLIPWAKLISPVKLIHRAKLIARPGGGPGDAQLNRMHGLRHLRGYISGVVQEIRERIDVRVGTS